MKKLSLFVCMLLINNSYADVNTNKNHTKTVNVTAFYGFLEDPKIKEAVEKQCNVNFSHDAYYTNAEFLRDFYKQKDIYDLAREKSDTLLSNFSDLIEVRGLIPQS